MKKFIKEKGKYIVYGSVVVVLFVYLIMSAIRIFGGGL